MDALPLEIDGARRYHLAGGCGIGMSALAQLLVGRGHCVTASDRAFDRDPANVTACRLARCGVRFRPQDGGGVRSELDALIVSSAVEDTNPEVIAARDHDVPIVRRAEMLAALFNSMRGIAVGGTSGKTTVTAMIGWMLDRCGLDPTLMVGGVMRSYESPSTVGNVRLGRSEWACIEADESDGTITAYSPQIAVLTTLSKDHDEPAVTRGLFAEFISHTRTHAVLPADVPELREIARAGLPRTLFGFSPNADVRADATDRGENGSRFVVDGTRYEIPLRGRHNVANALAAIAVGRVLGLADEGVADALHTFRGVARRLERVAVAGGVQVFDDFAHNPEKISAAMAAVRPAAGRLSAVFQPHGYGPLRFMREEFADAFAHALRSDDRLYLLPVYDAGGTADRTISSDDLRADLDALGASCEYVDAREDLVAELAARSEPGDVIIVMGARDESLSDLCRQITHELSGERETQ